MAGLTRTGCRERIKDHNGRGELMRTASGVFTILTGTLLGLYCIVLTMVISFDQWAWHTGGSYIIPILVFVCLPVAAFIFAGGILTLMGKYWGICLAAAILSTVVLPLNIISIIFVAVTKKQWNVGLTHGCSIH